MVLQESISISICLDSQCTEKSRGREATFSNDSNSDLADPNLVPRTFTSFTEKPNHFATKGGITGGFLKSRAFSYPKSNNASTSVGCLKECLAEEAISERASDLIIIKKRRYSLSLLISLGLKKTFIRFHVMWTRFQTFFLICLSQDMNIGDYAHISQQFQLSITKYSSGAPTGQFSYERCVQ